MIARAALALTLATCFPAPALSAALVLPCRPPVGQRFAFTLEQHGWTRQGRPSVIVIRRAMRFEAATDGALIVLGPAQATSNLTGAEARRLALLYAAGSERDARIQIDGQGQVVAIEDIEGHWRDYVARLEKLAALAETGGEGAARTRAMLAALRNADQATKIAAVDGAVAPLLRWCGQTVDGAADGPVVTIVERDRSQGVRQETQYRVARQSGLVMAIERHLVPLDQPDRPHDEYWRLEPADP